MLLLIVLFAKLAEVAGAIGAVAAAGSAGREVRIDEAERFVAALGEGLMFLTDRMTENVSKSASSPSPSLEDRIGRSASSSASARAFSPPAVSFGRFAPRRPGDACGLPLLAGRGRLTADLDEEPLPGGAIDLAKEVAKGLRAFEDDVRAEEGRPTAAGAD